MNLYKELVENLEENNKTIKEINFISIDINYNWNKEKVEKVVEIDINDFIEIAKETDYDNGYGGNEIPMSLKIVGEDWWLERHEYDGSEWFEFKTLPLKPVKKEKISQDEANKIGQDFLLSREIENMKATYYLKQGGAVTINYAYVQDDGKNKRHITTGALEQSALCGRADLGNGEMGGCAHLGQSGVR